MLAVTILGNNSALPAFDRHPTSQVVTLHKHLFLVDCGEGTQMQLTRYKIKRSRIQHVFISHLHGDHYFGLMGLITSMGLNGRNQELHVYAPFLLKEIIDIQMSAGHATLPFVLHFHSLNEGTLITDETFEVSCFKVFHRIDCWGFIFRERKPPRKLIGDKVKSLKVPTSHLEQLRWGKDYVAIDGTITPNDQLTIPSAPVKSYAFAADTAFETSVATKVKGVSLLYHETTYLHDLEERAIKRFHSTTVQAGTIAKMAEVKRLLIGHFSSKYENLEDFEKETRDVFPNTDLALEGVTYRV